MYVDTFSEYNPLAPWIANPSRGTLKSSASSLAKAVNRQGSAMSISAAERLKLSSSMPCIMLVIRVLRCTWKNLCWSVCMYQVATSQGRSEKSFSMLFLYLQYCKGGSYQPLLMFSSLSTDFRGALSCGTSALHKSSNKYKRANGSQSTSSSVLSFASRDGRGPPSLSPSATSKVASLGTSRSARWIWRLALAIL